jgi:acetolactate synthase I/II/III large subunit
MARVADYIARFLYDAGAKCVFLVSGGGMMHLSDAIVQHGKMQYVCTHHEQAAAMAAVTYARYNEGIGAAFVTTGCGGTNAITGLLDAWQDSTPCIFVSGQVKQEQTIRGSGLPLRQFGVQEADIVSIVDSLTKYAVVVEDPQSIAYYLEKALYLATTGRPGPVWLDVPLDVQSAKVDEGNLRHFSPSEIKKEYKEDPTQGELDALQEIISASKRPIIVAGQGIRLAKAIPQFREFVEKHNIPFVTPILGINLLPTHHPLYVGRIGSKGTRAGNFALQNSDLALVVGSRLSVSSIAYDYKNFAREAKHVFVDIDPLEHSKKTARIDLFINADAKRFFEAERLSTGDFSGWASKCRHWRDKWPVCLPEYSEDSKGINLYYFMDRLSAALRPDSAVVSDAGSSFFAVSQGIVLQEGQRYITSGCQAEMGFTLPATVGISVAKGMGEVVGVTGDGSFQMNLQELQTVVHYKLPIKLFVWNNQGYLSIRATQRKFQGGRLIGSDSSSGVSFPSVEKIAAAYGIKYFKADRSAKLDNVLAEVMAFPHAVLCEVMCNPDQEIVPVVSSYVRPDGTMASRPMEDMYPFMGREELKKEMIIKPMDE